MDVTFTHEHEELRGTVRRFLEKESSEQTVRKLMETESGYDPAIWQRMASELALPGLLISEREGGAGLGTFEAAIVLEEMGRVLFCGPYLSSAVLTPVALARAAAEGDKSKILGGIASGKTIATLAIAEESGRWDIDSIATKASRDGSKWRIDGVKNFVLDGHIADIILVAARA